MNEIQRNKTRSSYDTTWINFLLNLGFEEKIIWCHPMQQSEVETKYYTKRQVQLAKQQIEGQLAYDGKWPSHPSPKVPGLMIKSIKMLKEFSLVASCLQSLYGDKIQDGLTMKEIIHCYDMYTNLRHDAESPIKDQLSIGCIYHIVNEIKSFDTVIAYCDDCEVNYYSSVNQHIKNQCPYCNRPSKNDPFAISQC